MDKVYRVFYHELGHFVARQLNFLYYNGPEPFEIEIFPSVDHPDDYCGRTEVIRPEGYMPGEPIPLERLPSCLLATIYGCIFQSYFQESRLNDCFRVYGEVDTQNFTGALLKREIFNHDRFHAIKFQIFERLVNNRLLDVFQEIEPGNYLQAEEGSRFSVNIDRLRTD